MRLLSIYFVCVALIVPGYVIAQSNSYSISVDSNSAAAGDAITVEWTTNASTITNDWIGLYHTSASDRSYISWKYIDAKQGSIQFVLPEHGTYEFRYFPNNGYSLADTSSKITVSDNEPDPVVDEPNYTLTTNKKSYQRGDTVEVTWNTTAAANSRDWIGLYNTGDGDQRYLQWQYVDGKNGSFDFTIDRSGEYEFRYFLNNGYELVSTSDEFTVDDPDTEFPLDNGNNDSYSLTTEKTQYKIGETAEVTWAVPTGESFKNNWIGLYRPGTSDTQYLDYEYVDRQSDSEVFPLNSAGTFEFRFFTNNSYNKIATSQRIEVQNDTSQTCQLNTQSITNFPTPNGPIVALGDSLTFGVGASAGQDYVSELENRLSINIFNEGISGDSTVDALDRLEEDVLSRNPSAVIVLLGGNDEIRRFYQELSNTLAGRNLQDELDELAQEVGYDWMAVPLISRAETFANIETIIQRIQNTGAATILVGFDATIFNAQIDDAYRQIAENTGSFYVADIYDGVFGRPRFMSDLVHPNNAGYDIFADRIEPAVECVI